MFFSKSRVPALQALAQTATDSFGLGHEPTHPPALFQAGSASETPRNWDLQGLHQLIMDVEKYYAPHPLGPGDWPCPKFPLARCKLSRNTFRQITTLFLENFQKFPTPKKSARPNVEFQVRHFGGVVVFGVVFGSCVQEAAEFWVWRVFECNFRGKSTVLSGRRRHHKPRAQRAAE